MWSRISSLLTSSPSRPAFTAAYIQYLQQEDGIQLEAVLRQTQITIVLAGRAAGLSAPMPAFFVIPIKLTEIDNTTTPISVAGFTHG